jgi:hypothetical protein
MLLDIALDDRPDLIHMWIYVMPNGDFVQGIRIFLVV